MSSNFSKNKPKPFLTTLSDSAGSPGNDESVYAPTRKLPNIPIQLSDLYDDISLIEDSSSPEIEPLNETFSEEIVAQTNPYNAPINIEVIEVNEDRILEEEIITQTNSYQPHAKVKNEEPSIFEPNLPSFEVKLDPNSSTAGFEKNAILKEQLESVDFYIEQGFLDVAFSTLEKLEAVFPAHPLISERLEKMATLEIKNASQGIQVPFMATELPKDTIKETLKKVPLINDMNLSEKVFQVPNTAELPSLQDIVAVEPEVEMDFKSLVTDNAKLTSSNSLEDLSSNQNNEEVAFSEMPIELYQTITDDEEVENIVNQVDSAAAEIAAVQNGLRSLLDEAEVETTPQEDANEEFSSHFNIGQAYFDIELFDDAIEEFQNAYRSIQPLGASPKIFRCCMLLGKCFRLKEMPRPALIWLRKALDTKEYQESERLELFYELAGVYEELGEQKKALDLYQEIVKIDSNYLDVTKRLSSVT
ncbi:MAG: tetratricopeptide repeat protein [Acidobacteria bacterium]|nr:tetratricopeptide repeat protein [Acidobacteriota bacterium]